MPDGERQCRYCGEPSGRRMYCSGRCKQAQHRLRANEDCFSLSLRVELPLHAANDLHALGVDVDDPDALGTVLADGALWRLRSRG